jgi:NitT/TauT family transport system substrate-binding protein
MRLRMAFWGALGVMLAWAGAPPAVAADKIVAGAVGGPTATAWPFYIGMSKGYFAAEGIDLDIIYAQTAPGILQQLAGGSLDIVATTGLVEPIHAVDKGAPIIVLRVIGQVSPYAMLAKPSIKSLAELKGKTVTLGGLIDITRIYFDRMMNANGLKTGDWDVIVIGATGARFAALKSGAVDAAMLLPPFNFHAEAAGFPNIGLVIDYVKDLPFTGVETTRPWAMAHKPVIARILKAIDQSVAFFSDNANRQESIEIMNRYAKLDPDDVSKSYDFLRKIDFFAHDDKVSKRQLVALIKSMQAIGDIGPTMAVDQLVMSGLTELGD